jgi:hypothetical protein
LADEHGFLDLGEDLDEVPGLLGVEFLAAAHDTTAFVAEAVRRAVARPISADTRHEEVTA